MKSQYFSLDDIVKHKNVLFYLNEHTLRKINEDKQFDHYSFIIFYINEYNGSEKDPSENVYNYDPMMRLEQLDPQRQESNRKKLANNLRKLFVDQDKNAANELSKLFGCTPAAAYNVLNGKSEILGSDLVTMQQKGYDIAILFGEDVFEDKDFDKKFYQQIKKLLDYDDIKVITTMLKNICDLIKIANDKQLSEEDKSEIKIVSEMIANVKAIANKEIGDLSDLLKYLAKPKGKSIDSLLNYLSIENT